ncbi:unnamed protein product [Mytilus edulis]|uniref:Uncharacterized protein n=1 Tax=Mytilus edulis TaxID=6550 RepID=A0A8S3SBI4_MYTED|nr:unnamed protein product [Mytilus edulis]
MDDTTDYLTNTLSFYKPPLRITPFDQIKTRVYGKGNTVSDILVYSRILSRNIIDFPVHYQGTGQTVPFWTVFNCLLSEKSSNVALVTYPPLIDAKPTDMSTVFTAMKKCLDMSNEAGQAYAIQSFDQQLCAIVQQVKWSIPDIFESHILRLGSFHTLSCIITSLGKLWANGGLRYLLVEFGC